MLQKSSAATGRRRRQGIRAFRQELPASESFQICDELCEISFGSGPRTIPTCFELASQSGKRFLRGTGGWDGAKVLTGSARHVGWPDSFGLKTRHGGPEAQVNRVSPLTQGGVFPRLREPLMPTA